MARIPIDPLTGVDRAKAEEIIQAGRIPAEAAEQATVLAERLWSVFADEDATLVEVNPMALTDQGDVLAVDGKVSLDDNAAFRQPDHAEFEDKEAADPLEARAKAKHLNYVKLDGQVGIIGNGAGLVMSTLDVVALAGEQFGGIRPANFLDIGGGASAEVMADGLEIVLSDPSVRSVAWSTCSAGSPPADAVANGIVSAIGMLASQGNEVRSPSRSWVRRWTGNNAEEGRWRILADGRAAHGRAGGHHGRRCARRAAELAVAPATVEHEMAIFLTSDSRANMIQGITGSEGRKHALPDAAPPATNVVGGTNPRKAGQTVDLDGSAEVPVFARWSARRWRGDRRGRLGRLRPPGRSTKSAAP